MVWRASANAVVVSFLMDSMQRAKVLNLTKEAMEVAPPSLPLLLVLFFSLLMSTCMLLVGYELK